MLTVFEQSKRIFCSLASFTENLFFAFAISWHCRLSFLFAQSLALALCLSHWRCTAYVPFDRRASDTALPMHWPKTEQVPTPKHLHGMCSR